MNSKKWLNIFLLLSFFSIGFVGLINYIVDPLWVFNHSNKLNKLQDGFNERMSKSAYIKYHDDVLKDKDTLLLGTSTSTYFDEKKFPGYSVYNYSVSAGNPREYEALTSFAESVKNEKFDNIMLGLDFSRYFSTEKVSFDMNDFDSNKVTFSFKKYLSIDMLKYSWVNIKNSLNNTTGHRAYTRNNRVVVDNLDESKVNEIVEQSKNYLNHRTVDTKFLATLKSYKNKYYERNFIVYTTPLAKPILDEIYSDKRLYDAYIQWIRDVTEVFGTVYFFTLPNEFSENYLTESKDGIHFYPEVGAKIGEIISHEKMKDDLGIVLTRGNINESLIILKTQIDRLSQK
jgi:hypothetical protein